MQLLTTIPSTAKTTIRVYKHTTAKKQSYIIINKTIVEPFDMQLNKSRIEAGYIIDNMTKSQVTYVKKLKLKEEEFKHISSVFVFEAV